MKRSYLWLVGVMLAVVAAGLVLSTVIDYRASAAEFERYASHNRRDLAERLAPLLASYYELNGGWGGVDSLLTDRSVASTSNQRIALADARWNVLVDSLGKWKDGKLPSANRANAVPVESMGLTVGWLVVNPFR
ncbi:MAG: hypothetical protein ACYC1C_07660, partial [Chloroflexota bacterium]